MRYFGQLSLGIWLIAAAPAAPAQDATHPAAVVLDPLVQKDTNFPREMAALVEQSGYAVQLVDSAILTNPAALTPERFSLLLVPQGRSLPAAATGPITSFLKAGGNLVALGAPLWEHPLFPFEGRWISRADYEATLGQVRPQKVWFDFRNEDLSKWRRNSNFDDRGFLKEAAGTEEQAALHVRSVCQSGWETLFPPVSGRLFVPGHSLTCFRAKGGPRTRRLSLEFIEQDSSRWIAVVELGTEWRSYALPPGAFRPWVPPAGRGGAADRLQVGNVRQFSVGLADSHGADMRGTNEYWIADIGTAPNPFGDFEPPAQGNLPRLEALSPGYLFFPITAPVELALVPAPGQPRPGGLRAPIREPLLGLHPRAGGAGYDQGRPWRWQPLLEARSGDGEHRGTVAVLVVNTGGGTTTAFTPGDPAFYRQEAVRSLLSGTLDRIRRGLFLLEGGAEFFTLFTNQPVRVGARVSNQSFKPSELLSVRLEAVHASRTQRAFRFEAPVAPGPRQAVAVETNWLPTFFPPHGYQVTVELLEDGRVIDRLAHELQSWQPRRLPHFVEARDGGLWLEGRPWKAHGVNYMPSSGIALGLDYFEHWVGRGAYDPVVIDRDLRRIKAMNLNAVSVFVYHRSLQAQHLLDFLRRCEDLGLRVNLSLRPGTPLDFRWPEMKALIEHYRLGDNDTVFAYDLAWEPSHYDQAYQEKNYTPRWREWVRHRYGDAQAAELAWRLDRVDSSERKQAGYKAGSVPPMAWLTRDGPWWKLAADYRQFLDQLLGTAYAEARRLVLEIDPHHPVSFRMQLAGDPTHNSAPLPYDFFGLAGAVDIWEPEAYGRIGDWDRVRPGRFTAAYARLCDPAKPVLWAEMGNSVWDMTRMAPSPERLEFTARYYADFYRMMIESGADGVFFWWYPGGFRLNENSDYGIINPDGTDREITRVIRAEGTRFLAAPKPPPPDYWIAVDRDRDARGLPGLYEAVQAEYWWAIAEGHVPGLKWAKQPGVAGD